MRSPTAPLPKLISEEETAKLQNTEVTLTWCMVFPWKKKVIS